MYEWAKRINERSAVKKGTAVPAESKIVNPAYEVRLEGEEGFEGKERELREIGERAKEEYGYKYASP